MRKASFLWLIPMAVLAWRSLTLLQGLPLDVFLLKGSDNNVEAYRLKIGLGGREPSVEAVALSSDQRQEGLDILKRADVDQLASFSKGFGERRIFIGDPTSEDGWPSYLGGGWNALFGPRRRETFDNLQWADRIYLAFATVPPPPAPAGGVVENPSTPPPAGAGTSTLPSAVAPSPVPSTPSGVLRVEILNGCGIKGAADWAARRLKGDGIVVTDTGNAENFHYPQTLVRSSAGIPIALEEAVEKLGLTKAAIQETADLPAAVDVVVVLGKDYRQLKERVRDRNQH